MYIKDVSTINNPDYANYLGQTYTPRHGVKPFFFLLGIIH